MIPTIPLTSIFLMVIHFNASTTFPEASPSDPPGWSWTARGWATAAYASKAPCRSCASNPATAPVSRRGKKMGGMGRWNWGVHHSTLVDFDGLCIYLYNYINIDIPKGRWMEYAERWDVNYQPRIPDPKWGDGRVGDGEKIAKRGENPWFVVEEWGNYLASFLIMLAVTIGAGWLAKDIFGWWEHVVVDGEIWWVWDCLGTTRRGHVDLKGVFVVAVNKGIGKTGTATTVGSKCTNY